MALKLCCTFFVAIILTINVDIYAIPLSDLIDEQKTSDASDEFGTTENSTISNSTINGTKKNLYVK